MNTTKNFEDLNFADDIIFGNVMRNEANAKPFLEAVLGRKIDRIEVCDMQKTLESSFDSRGIRLDVFIKDGAGTIYDVEIQTGNKKDFLQRIRYYQSGIDISQLQKGISYRNLNDSYVIFIMTEDFLDIGFAMCCPVTYFDKSYDRLYEDGRHVILLNAEYSNDNVPQDVRAFLDYIRAVRNNNGSIDLTGCPEYVRNIDRSVQEEKQDSTVRRSFMTLKMRLDDEREEGKAEGIATGLAEGKAAGLAEGKAAGLAEGKAAGLAEGKAAGLAEGKAAGLVEGKAVGLAEGKAIGLAEGKIQMLSELVKDNILSMQVAASRAGISEEEFRNRIQ